LFALIKRLRERELAIVYISHFLEEVAAVCDRFTVLRDGCTTGTGSTRDTSSSAIVAMMVGRQVDDLYPRNERTPGEVLLRLDNVAGEKKPASASLELRRGEVVGIAGILGTGRTELLRAVFGLDAIKSGEVRVASYSGGSSPGDRWRQGVGMVSEDRKQEGLALELPVSENITLPRLAGCGPGWFVTPSGQDRASAPWLRALQIKCVTPQQPVATLSGGNQQKVALARLLHADVDLLLLDEPTRGIDVGSKAEIYRLIDQLATGDTALGKRPRAVLIVSSYLPELLGVCDRIAVMCRGNLGPCRPVEELDEHRIMLAATGADSF
jgi:ribose transport system ATP-binding protein